VGIGGTNDEEVRYDSLCEVDSRLHYTWRGDHIGVIKICALICLTTPVGEEEPNSVKDLML
jgi:hypothetical protein